MEEEPPYYATQFEDIWNELEERGSEFQPAKNWTHSRFLRLVQRYRDDALADEPTASQPWLDWRADVFLCRCYCKSIRR
jgi:hypothetical protein